MFHSRTLNKINRLHEKCLRIIYNGNTSSLTDLLEIYISVSLRHRNMQVLAIELYKFVNGLSPNLVSDCFKLNNMTVYSNKNRSTFYSRLVRTVLHGTESLSHLEPKIWEFVPSDIKNLSSLTAFKKAIKQCKPHACPYQVGFVQPSNTKPTFSSWFSCFIYIYVCMHVYVCEHIYVCVMLLEHYSLQFYLSFYTSVN